MTKTIGFDLGTNSIGWAVIDNSKEYENQILNSGVRIFSEGVNIDESSKASERTKYRSGRRLKFRRKLRKYNTLKVLLQNNMCPLTIEQLNAWRYEKEYPQTPEFLAWLRTEVAESREERKLRNKNPYAYRTKAVNEVIDDKFMLGRAFYHLAQRRGFKSNRLEQGTENSAIENYISDVELLLEGIENIEDLVNSFTEFCKQEFDKTDKEVKSLFVKLENYLKYWKNEKSLDLNIEIDKIRKTLKGKENLSPVKKAISELSNKISASGSKTMGEYFYTLYQKGDKIRKQYTHREEHYEHEFYAICEKQNIEQELVTQLYRAIFFQRQLRSQKGLVGKCTFDSSKPRCPISHPLFEEYRMYSFINNIKWKLNKENTEFEPLTDEMREKIIPLFYRKKTQFTFEDIAKKLTPKGKNYAYWKSKEADGVYILFNYNMNTSISGNIVSAFLKDIFGENWKQTEIAYSYNFFDKKENKDVEKHAKADIYDIWHVLFTYESSEKLEAFAKQKLKLSEEQTKKIKKVPIKQGYANLSLKAIRKILPFLEQKLILTYAIFLANIEEVVGADIWKNNSQLIINNCTIIKGIGVVL